MDVVHARVEESVRIALPPNAGCDALLERIIGAAREVAGDADAVGFAAPGPFDYDNGVAWLGHKLEPLYGADLRSPLAHELRLPLHAVQFLNDADVFGLGEWWAGAAKGARESSRPHWGPGWEAPSWQTGRWSTTGMGSRRPVRSTDCGTTTLRSRRRSPGLR